MSVPFLLLASCAPSLRAEKPLLSSSWTGVLSGMEDNTEKLAGGAQNQRKEEPQYVDTSEPSFETNTLIPRLANL